MIANAGPSALWYLTRGTGLVALVLLTATVALGVMTNSRWQRPGWPRFASLGLHRNISLLTVVFLAVHILTAELDTFAPVGWPAAVVPFSSTYRPLWLGLGTVAFDLLLALVVTSLLRGRLGLRAWRAVHWLAYLSWPVALIHGLGTGTDARLWWFQTLGAGCVLVVVAVVGSRLARAPRAHVKTVGATAAAATVLGIALWASTGPFEPGWAKRAGTPPSLLATTRTVNSTTVAPAGPSGRPNGSDTGLPPLPFEASISGTFTQTGPDAAGQVTVTVDARVSGSMTGSLLVVLRGQSAGNGVSMSSSSVAFGPSRAGAKYRGRVVLLNGDQLVAAVKDDAGSRLELGLLLQLDPTRGSVAGTLQAGVASASVIPSGGDGDSDGGR